MASRHRLQFLSSSPRHPVQRYNTNAPLSAKARHLIERCHIRLVRRSVHLVLGGTLAHHACASVPQIAAQADRPVRARVGDQAARPVGRSYRWLQKHVPLTSARRRARPGPYLVMTWPPSVLSAAAGSSAQNTATHASSEMRTGRSSSTLTPASARLRKAAAPAPGRFAILT